MSSSIIEMLNITTRTSADIFEADSNSNDAKTFFRVAVHFVFSAEL